ncbi:TonB-dependent hemoglobin/transferrin/lactoferrin family receptor [Pseudoalteromonas mariniglutinosa]|uniref:TonB-dependent hemoglobin/transferrin/lactoferrin family receptor n=1 Tax=Pseudoalteromonas mariniglutinosa TaxID=206042 RepID=UPI00384F764B
MHTLTFKLSLIATALISSSSAFAEKTIAERIVVSGSRFEQKLEDVTGSVTVITGEDIDRQLAVDLQGMFKYDPSISTTGSGGQGQTLTVRGVGGNRVVFIKDGRRTNDGYAGGSGYLVGRGYFDVAGIKQVEVAKGAASSLYGSDALGGIVVITTKDPSDYLNSGSSFAEFGLGYQGDSEQVAVDFSAAKQLTDNFAASVVLSHREGEEVQNYSETLPGYDTESTALLMKLQQRIDDKRTLKYTLDLFKQDTTQVITPKVQETDDTDSNYAFAIDYNSALKTTWYDRFQGHASFSRYEQKSQQISDATNYTDFNDYRFEQAILGLRAVFNKEISTQQHQHGLVYGADIDLYDTTRPRFKTRLLADGSTDFENQKQKAFPGADTTLVGLFVQDNITFINSNWSLVAGLRYDYYTLAAKSDALYADTQLNDIDESALSPKLGAIYQVNNNLSFYGQYGRGFKIPPHDQAYQSHGVEPFYQILANADLNPEKSDSFELGMRYSNDDVNFSLSVFHASYKDFIETATVGSEPTFIPGVNKTFYQYQNISETGIRGIEMNFAAHLTDSLLLETSIAYADGENKETDQPLTSISPLNGALLLSQEFNDFVFTGAWRVAKSQSDVPVDMNGQKTTQGQGYGVLDLYASVELQQWRVNIGLSNVFDKHYVLYELIAGQSQDADFSQYSQPGRNFAAHISYQF